MMLVKVVFVIVNLLALIHLITSRGLNRLSFTRIPNVNEQSILASGPFIKTANESGLTKVMPTKYLHLHNNNTVLTSEACFKKLQTLVNVVQKKFHQKYILFVLIGYARMQLINRILHYEGRALDLKLKRTGENTDEVKDDVNGKAKIDRIHHRLAWFAYHKAGFSFAKVSKNYHGEHVHVSCRRVQH